MKTAEITRELKEQLWQIFDAGQTFAGVENVTINAERIPREALEKQLRLWREYRARNPKKR